MIISCTPHEIKQTARNPDHHHPADITGRSRYTSNVSGEIWLIYRVSPPPPLWNCRPATSRRYVRHSGLARALPVKGLDGRLGLITGLLNKIVILLCLATLIRRVRGAYEDFSVPLLDDDFYIVLSRLFKDRRNSEPFRAMRAKLD